MMMTFGQVRHVFLQCDICRGCKYDMCCGRCDIYWCDIWRGKLRHLSGHERHLQSKCDICRVRYDICWGQVRHALGPPKHLNEAGATFFGAGVTSGTSVGAGAKAVGACTTLAGGMYDFGRDRCDTGQGNYDIFVGPGLTSFGASAMSVGTNFKAAGAGATSVETGSTSDTFVVARRQSHLSGQVRRLSGQVRHLLRHVSHVSIHLSGWAKRGGAGVTFIRLSSTLCRKVDVLC